ncbi:MAG TPA: hypothetical protein DD734_04845, partial [Firmicutes bacterium]|nr:hypothetical protein [Bacillota bacterium]
MKISALFVDVGATDRSDAEKDVKIGDLIAFDVKAEAFGDGLFKGKAL